MASPFIFDQVDWVLGFKNVAQTSLKTYLEVSQLAGGSEESTHGASYEMSIYWQFIGRPLFYSPEFVKYMKLTILGLNVYYFFIRKWCLIECFKALFRTLTL